MKVYRFETKGSGLGPWSTPIANNLMDYGNPQMPFVKFITHVYRNVDGSNIPKIAELIDRSDNGEIGEISFLMKGSTGKDLFRLDELNTLFDEIESNGVVMRYGKINPSDILFEDEHQVIVERNKITHLSVADKAAFHNFEFKDCLGYL